MKPICHFLLGRMSFPRINKCIIIISWNPAAGLPLSPSPHTNRRTRLSQNTAHVIPSHLAFHCRYEGEVDLHRVVVTRLLPVLVRRRGACRRVVQLPEWRQLAAAFAGGAPTLRALAEPQQRWLARSLCLAAAGLPDENAASQYVHDLVTPLVGKLLSFPLSFCNICGYLFPLFSFTIGHVMFVTVMPIYVTSWGNDFFAPCYLVLVYLFPFTRIYYLSIIYVYYLSMPDFYPSCVNLSPIHYQ